MNFWQRNFEKIIQHNFAMLFFENSFLKLALYQYPRVNETIFNTEVVAFWAKADREQVGRVQAGGERHPNSSWHERDPPKQRASCILFRMGCCAGRVPASKGNGLQGKQTRWPVDQGRRCEWDLWIRSLAPARHSLWPDPFGIAGARLQGPLREGSFGLPRWTQKSHGRSGDGPMGCWRKCGNQHVEVIAGPLVWILNN